eukprot:COSAG01_NODE_22557_length_850_cov_2.299601_1_plen_87_part_00
MVNYGLDPMGTKDQDTAQDHYMYSRAQILVPKGAKVNNPPKKTRPSDCLKQCSGVKTLAVNKMSKQSQVVTVREAEHVDHLQYLLG